MAAADSVLVEFFGVPRSRAGQATLHVAPGTVGEVLSAVERACPRLAGLVQADGRLAPQYLLSIGGRSFITDLTQRLGAGEELLLLSADIGG